jgi:hypothetical protein
VKHHTSAKLRPDPGPAGSLFLLLIDVRLLIRNTSLGGFELLVFDTMSDRS